MYTDGSSENGATLIGSFEFDYGNGGEICISITGASSTRQYYSSTYNNASLDAYLSMTISNGGEANETYFEDLRLEVIDANGNVAYITSSSNVIDTTNHVLEANWTAIAPTINIETTTNTVAYGVNDAILTANAVHDLAKTYQWYCSTTSGFTPDSSNAIVGAIDETYTHEATSKNVGTYYYKCIVTANGLSTTSNEITITVSKADILLTPTINNGLEYNGSAQVLMSLTDNDGIPNNIYYKVGTELTSSNYSTTGSTSLPTGTEAGDYNVYFYIPTSTNYNAISGKVLVSIAKAENVITVVTKQNLEYTGSAIALLESATDENDDADGVIYYNVGTKLTSSNYSSAGSTTMPTVTNAGEHIIYMYVPETDNYKEVSGVAVVNIDKTSNLITPKPATGLVYNGTYQTLLTVTDNNDVSNDIYYSIGTELDADNLTDYGSKDLPTAKNSGTYVVYFYIPETTNYKLISGFCEVTIDYLETTLTINPNGGYWGGTTSNSTFTQVNGTTLRVDNPTRAGYTFTDWDFVATELADGAILTFAGLENNVYTFDVGNITLTAKWEAIVPTVSISIDKTSIVYGSETATLTATCEHELAITYQWHRSTTSGFTPSSTTALGGGVNAVYTHNKLATNAGTYYYKCVVTVNGMTATSSQVQLVVEKLNNSFETILDQNLVYNGQPQTLVEVVDNDGIDNNVYYSVGTKLTSSNYSTSGSKTVPTETNAGDYIVYFYVPTSDNYNELSGKIPVSIAMADNTFELIRYQGLVYNAQSQTLAQVIDNDGIDNNVYYRVVNVNEDTGDMKLNSTNYKDNGTTNLPSAIYSGKYNIYFYVPASDNFNELSGVTQGEIATKYTTLTVNPNGGIWN
ncbi:MAG: hypothetical protein IJ371_02165 [Clostridia bacterium]|nr:hypothetical protein [Clostridia bacterium]